MYNGNNECTKEITKEVYERSCKHRNHIAHEDEKNVFSDSERYGYGVYSTHTYEKDGKYYVEYTLGSTCD